MVFGFVEYRAPEIITTNFLFFPFFFFFGGGGVSSSYKYRITCF